MSELSMDKRKEWAKELFIKENLTQKAIADRVGVSENSLSKWVIEGNWKALRTSLLVTRSTEIRHLLEQLALLDEQNLLALTDDDPETNPNYDSVIKLAAAIRKLEIQTGIGEMIDTGMALIKFISAEELELAKKLTTYFDLFIESKQKAL